MAEQSPDNRPTLWEQEPFATVRAEPRRFWIGIPVVFVVGAVAGALLLGTSLGLALAAQLGLQTVGFMWLYVPAVRRRLGRGGGSGGAS